MLAMKLCNNAKRQNRDAGVMKTLSLNIGELSVGCTKHDKQTSHVWKAIPVYYDRWSHFNRPVNV